MYLSAQLSVFRAQVFKRVCHWCNTQCCFILGTQPVILDMANIVDAIHVSKDAVLELQNITVSSASHPRTLAFHVILHHAPC